MLQIKQQCDIHARRLPRLYGCVGGFSLLLHRTTLPAKWPWNAHTDVSSILTMSNGLLSPLRATRVAWCHCHTALAWKWASYGTRIGGQKEDTVLEPLSTNICGRPKKKSRKWPTLWGPILKRKRFQIIKKNDSAGLKKMMQQTPKVAFACFSSKLMNSWTCMRPHLVLIAKRQRWRKTRE